MSEFICLNGKIIKTAESVLHPMDRGFLLSDGIFETMLWHNQIIFRFDDHWQRFNHAAKIINLSMPVTAEFIQSMISELITINQLLDVDAAVRITLTRGPGARGIVIPKEVNPTLLITVAALPKAQNSNSDLYISSIKRNEYSPLSIIKSTSYLENILARQEAINYSATDAIFFNTQNYLACATVANIFIVINNQVMTPRIEDGVLPGITRKIVLEICENINQSVIIKSINKELFNQATEIFLTNSLIGIQSVDSVSGRKLSANKDITDNIKQHYVNYLTNYSAK